MTSFANLMPELLELTEAGKIEWTKSGDNIFVTTVPNGTILIRVLGSSEPQYLVAIYNDDGEMVDRVSVDLKLKDSIPRNLFIAARRSALKIDATLDALAKHLATLKG